MLTTEVDGIARKTVGELVLQRFARGEKKSALTDSTGARVVKELKSTPLPLISENQEVRI